MFARSRDDDELRRELAAARAQAAEVPALRAALTAAQARLAAAVSPTAAAPGGPADRDPLTGVLTATAFRDHAHLEVERARRSGVVPALMLVDVDGWRELAARRGHAAGDAALDAVSRTVATLVRSGDLVGRTGSDEIAVLLHDTNAEGARDCATRLLRELEAAEPPESGAFTVSIGLATYVRGDSVERLVATAARGVHQARLAGGGRIGLPEEDETIGATPDLVGLLRRDVHLDVAEALAAALHERDPATGEHSRSVVAMSLGVARVLGLDPLETERIGAAALLHDIGKVALPDRILHKPGALDDDEWVRVRELPVIGERILRAIPGLGPVARIVRHEHERYDGTGYPDGLAGAEIPIGSRIILACDTYNSMTSGGPHRARMTHADAVRELATCAGTQFDPKVTEALISDLHQAQQLGFNRIDDDGRLGPRV